MSAGERAIGARATGAARLRDLPALGARAALRRRLAGLRRGALAVTDPWGGWRAGEGETCARIDVHRARFYPRVVLGGGLGFAEAYMDGDWDSDDPTAVVALFARNVELVDGVEGGASTLANAFARARHALRRNSRGGARRNVRAHYDLGNDFFALFLDPTMTYSAGVFEHPDATMEEASIAKLDLICRKLSLGPRDHVVEIGTGWGSFAIHAAGRYGCRVTTTTISREQHALARERVRAAGLDDRVEVWLRDYRDLGGTYDKLVSIEMIEAVGHDFLPGYLAKCAELLREDGAALVQAIAMPDRRYERYLASSDFVREHVFPGSNVPSFGAIVDAMRRGSDLRAVHVEDIGPHYATTLARWRERFEARLDDVRALGYPERFVRMWRYYLCYCEAGFAERYTRDLQILMHRPACRLAPRLPAAREAIGAAA